MGAIEILTSPKDADAVLAQMPEDGSPIVTDVAVARAIAGGLSMHRAWGALAALYADRMATSWREGGVTWARRLG